MIKWVCDTFDLSSQLSRGQKIFYVLLFFQERKRQMKRCRWFRDFSTKQKVWFFILNGLMLATIVSACVFLYKRGKYIHNTPQLTRLVNLRSNELNYSLKFWNEFRPMVSQWGVSIKLKEGTFEVHFLGRDHFLYLVSTQNF